MSTDHQQYSTENQSDVITLYAASHEMEVVRSYADLGKSGLTLRHRPGLAQLLKDVESGAADFSAILVYDISRWGRFQDADESAYYEYRCKRAKIAVHYCAEIFANDGSISSTILKTLKRAMAGEFSRELSVKVFAGKSRLAELGFRQGGAAGHGLRRMLVDRDGVEKGLLNHGDRKSLLTDRVILVPGPDNEVQAVRDIYDRFVNGRDSPTAIARALNEAGVPHTYERPWTLALVREILTNAKYIGANVTNRTSYKLSKRHVKNPPEMWIRRDRAFAPLIDTELFEQAQKTMEARVRHSSDEEMLDRLRTLWKRAGILTGDLVDRSPDMPSHAMYTYRFGGMLGTYRRIGYVPPDDYSYIEQNKRLIAVQAESINRLIEEMTSLGASIAHENDSQLIVVNEEYSVFFAVVRCRHTKYRGPRWFVPRIPSEVADIRIAARMTSDNVSVLDYYVFPKSVSLTRTLDLGERNNVFIDIHRFDDLEFVKSLARRSHMEEST